MALFIPNVLPVIEQPIKLTNKLITNYSTSMSEFEANELQEPNSLVVTNEIKTQYNGMFTNESIDLLYNFVRSTIKFNVDYKTDIFRLNTRISFGHKTEIGKKRTYPVNYQIQANNDSKYSIDVRKESEMGFADEFFYSTNMGGIKYSELKVLSVIIWLGGKKFEYLFKFNQPKPYNKNLFLQPKFSFFKIWLQSGIEIESFHKTTIKPIFDYLILEPNKLSQNEHNIDIVQLGGTNGTDPFDRILFKPYKISGLPLSLNSKNKKYEFEPIFDENRPDRLKFVENTYYDLKDKETKIGPGKNSSPGYIIPYSYDQNFYPSLEFDFGILKKLKLTWIQKINKPYFDVDKNKGIVKLLMKMNDEEIRLPNSSWYRIDTNFFEMDENKNITYSEMIKKLRFGKENKNLAKGEKILV